MDELEISAKTVDDAITQALNKLNVDRSQINVEVINKGKQGILGFGAEEAKIRVRLIEKTVLPDTEVAELAKEVLRTYEHEFRVVGNQDELDYNCIPYIRNAIIFARELLSLKDR